MQEMTIFIFGIDVANNHAKMEEEWTEVEYFDQIESFDDKVLKVSSLQFDSAPKQEVH
jgi:hypothetical protein